MIDDVADVIYAYYNYTGSGPSRYTYALSDGKLSYSPGKERFDLINLASTFPDENFYYLVVYTTTGYHTPLPGEPGFWYRPFNLQTLPVLEAHTLKHSWDKEGNLVITWEAPYTYNTPDNVSTNARLYIILVDQPPYMKYVMVTAPTHLGSWFIPKAIVEQLEETLAQLNPTGHKHHGDEVDLQLIVRTTDKSNRTYSNVKSISLRDKWHFGEDD